MKKNLLILLCLWLCKMANAQEKLLYSTDFQNWANQAATSSEVVISKTTDFSNETLNFKLLQIAVSPTGRDESRFNYSLVSTGWAQAQKVVGSYMELSPLQSITKVVFQHGATGSSRGYKLWKKSATDADWVAVSSAFANPATGQEVTVNINEANVALKFTNLNDAQNAYMFSLKIYGNYTSANPQYDLTTSQNIAAAGTITRTPNSDKYDAGVNVSLQATPNFGYHFVKWVDGNTDADISSSNPLPVAMDAAKSIKAIFEAVTTFTYTVNIAGSQWGQVSLNPAPTGGKYEAGTTVTMKVVPNKVTTFSYWDNNTTAPERTIVVDGNKTFTATFDEVPFIVGWDLRNATPGISRTGDYYAATTNTGLLSTYNNSGVVGWLANGGAFSPALPNLRLWTPGVEFDNNRRYLKAQFSTENYRNIQVASLVCANYQTYSKQLIQYSLDDINYTTLNTVDITNTYNVSWIDLNATLPADAENKTRVYIRWIADITSPKLGNAADNDGTAFTNIFVFAEKLQVVDNDAPLLVATVPASGSQTATVNGSVVVTFNERVKAGSGNITLGGKTLTAVYGSKTATFTYEKLNYNTDYTFTIPAGAITDMSGNAFAGTSFSFKTSNRTEPTKKLFDAVVALDGSGDYTSVIDAIAAAPTGRTLPWLIYIKEGKYTGHHDIPVNKPFIHLIGQERDKVIISDNRLSGGPTAVHVSVGATMVVNAKDCYFENITFENSWGHEQQAGPQALALYTLTDRFTMNKCFLRSYQDTYLTAYSAITDRHYIKNSRIQGAVDFIYGGGDVLFDKCDIVVTRKDGGYIVAPSHGAGTAWGYVFSNCTIDEDIATGVTVYYGRPWQNRPKTTWINTTLKAKVYASGWYYKMGAIPDIFADYNTMDAAGNPVDLSQRISQYEYDVKDVNGVVTGTVQGTAKKSLTNEEAAEYTYEKIMLRSGDSWDPRLMTEAPEAPAAVTVSNGTINWSAAAYSRLYIIHKNNKPIGFSIGTQFVDPAPGAVLNPEYSVQSVGEFGALSAVAIASDLLPVKGMELQAKASGNNVLLQWKTLAEYNSSHFEIEHSADGNAYSQVAKQAAAGNSSQLRSYQFVHSNLPTALHTYRIKMVDKDGSFEYSPIAVVRIQQDATLQVLPTAATDRITLLHGLLKENTEATIINAAGQIVQKMLLTKGSMQTSIGIRQLAAGAYIISIPGNSYSNVRFVKF
ncbi:MAG TPA: pectinesterase family protein [Phnomibacter sp.]|nr:pectinesterase family protein [Phnomibacter sp.]